MSDAWFALLGACVGGLAAIVAAYFTALKQEQIEHSKWTREKH
jgi:hypothetical protein